MKNIILFSVAALLVLSCNQESTDIQRVTSPEGANFTKLFNNDAANNILIENIGTLQTGDNKTNRIENVFTRSKATNEPVKFTADGREFGSPFAKKATAAVNTESLFGKEVSFQVGSGGLATKSTASATSANLAGNSTTLYIPELMNVQVSKLDNGWLVPGSVITWNRDPLNTNGIVVLVEYSPTLQRETSVLQTNTQTISRSLHLPDNGSYTVTQEDLAQFPNLSTLRFYMGRFAYTVTMDGSVNNDTSLGIYTAVTADFDIAY